METTFAIRTGFMLALALVVFSARSPAQSVDTSRQDNSVAPESSLPDAPGSLSSSSEPAAAGGLWQAATPKPAGPYDKYIAPGQPAPRLTVHDKAILGIKDAISPFSAVAWLVDAGYEQATNGSPNYGTNRVAFAQRFGAAAARDVSQGIFGDSILAPILHEDPRYYRLGPGHSFVHRVIYSGSRAILTRTDGGHTTINFAQLGGNLAGAALAQVYYPPINQGFNQTMQTFGGSVGGSALGFLVSEFLTNALQAVHLSSPPQ